MISTLLLCVNLATAALAADPFALKIREVAAVRPRSPDVVTDNFAVLSRSNIESTSSKYLRLVRRDFSPKDKPIGIATTPEFAGREFVVNVTFDGTEVPLIIDTGSSDVWVPAKNLTCVDDNMKVQPEAACGLGAYRFDGTPSGGWNKDVHMALQYGPKGPGGTFARGRAGYANITLAGINVTHQQVAIVNYTNFGGDGLTVGILGLGYPFNTNAFSGTNFSADGLSNHVIYDPIVTTMMKNNKAITSFSMAQPRGSPNAYIAFGGVPPVQYEDKFASTPIRTAEVLSPALKGQYVFYIATIQGFVYDGAPAPANATASTNATAGKDAAKEYYALVDSGTTDVYVPTDVYNAVLKQFQPPAIKIDGHQAQFAPCNATAPAFGVIIGGQTFQMSKDTMFTKEQDPVDVKGTKYCAASLRDGGTGGPGQPFVLGDAFLKNVVTVYDIGAAEMRFAPLK